MSYTINREFQLGTYEGDSRIAQPWYVIAHETANPTATGRNEATYMKRNWRNAYTTDIVGDGIDYRIGEWGYVSYGALNANPYAPVQIELQHTADPVLFKKNYAVYIELIREACDKYGIPKTLDTGGHGTKGVKSHQWVSKHIGGDHQDPYSYLASMGVSKAQFAKDIANGLGKSQSAAKPKPKPSKPASKPNTNKLSNKSFANGTKVKFLARASAYQTGEKIPAWVKKGTYTVKDKKTVNKSESVYAFLLSGINSWVLAQDLEVASKPKPKPKPSTSTSGKWIAENATFKSNQAIYLRESASTKGKMIALLPSGSTIKYNAYMIDKNGYVWIRQPRGKKYGYLATGQSKNGKRVNYWGSFK